MRYRKLPTDLKCRVHEYYYQRYHGHFFDEDAILGELSHALSEVGEISKTGTSSVNSYTQYTHTAHTHAHTHTLHRKLSTSTVRSWSGWYLSLPMLTKSLSLP